MAKNGNLNLARLPIPPRGHKTHGHSNTRQSVPGQVKMRVVFQWVENRRSQATRAAHSLLVMSELNHFCCVEPDAGLAAKLTDQSLMG